MLFGFGGRFLLKGKRNQKDVATALAGPAEGGKTSRTSNWLADLASLWKMKAAEGKDRMPEPKYHKAYYLFLSMSARIVFPMTLMLAGSADKRIT